MTGGALKVDHHAVATCDGTVVVAEIVTARRLQLNAEVEEREDER